MSESNMVWVLPESISSPCVRCDGCGKIANTERGEPWNSWESLPIISGLAVLAGFVKPLPCPDCDGTGKVARKLCSIHPHVNYRHHWGCPECLAELREEQQKILADNVALRDALNALRDVHCACCLRVMQTAQELLSDRAEPLGIRAASGH